MTPRDHWNFLIGTSFLFSFCFSASFDAFWVGGRVNQVSISICQRYVKKFSQGFTCRKTRK
jgi:hypothetical protein